MSAALIALAALLAQQHGPDPESGPVEPTAMVDEDGAFGWRCWAPVAIGRHKGSVWRDYGKKLENSAYIMNVERPAPGNPRTIQWAVDPRPDPPAGAKRRWPMAVREADAFRNGPSSVIIDFTWEPRALTGPLWVQFWGDGSYAGTQMMRKARDVRRYYGGERPAFTAGLTPSTALIARLASAQRWTAAAVDSTGRLLSSETFEMPTPDEAEAVFRKARARIDSLEPRFAIDHEPLDEGGAGCTDEENRAASI